MRLNKPVKFLFIVFAWLLLSGRSCTETTITTGVESSQKISDTAGNFEGTLDDDDRFGSAVAATYERVDRMIAEVVEAVGPEVRILVVSDHGVRPNLALTTDIPEPEGETSMPPAPLDEVWAYFATPKNLNEMTPPDIKFEIVGGS